MDEKNKNKIRVSIWFGYMNGIWSQNTGTARGPFSVLHLNGRDQNFVQDAGYRPYMKTGITFTDNQDFMYFGIRAVGTPGTYDVTENVIAWADNQSNTSGPDDFAFRFNTSGSGSTSISNNLNATNDLDGRHIARFTGQGRFWIRTNFWACWRSLCSPTVYNAY